ncbi:hypothetical protein JOB18_032113 [Solea senegalensis]|nr:hypothetical protein JOB18_032113 [Solea senegalensis]
MTEGGVSLYGRLFVLQQKAPNSHSPLLSSSCCCKALCDDWQSNRQHDTAISCRHNHVMGVGAVQQQSLPQQCRAYVEHETSWGRFGEQRPTRTGSAVPGHNTLIPACFPPVPSVETAVASSFFSTQVSRMAEKEPESPGKLETLLL